MKLIFMFIIGLSIHLSVYGLHPAAHSKLPYRLILFRFPEIPETSSCILQVAAGEIVDEKTFEQQLVATQHCSKKEALLEVPEFGKTYTWRLVYTQKNKNGATKGELHYFSTLPTPIADSSKYKLELLPNSEVKKHLFFFLDGTQALYNSRGEVVWFYEDKNGLIPEGAQVRDMKITPAGTITFLVAYKSRPEVYEIDYEGNVLWKGPNKGVISGDTIENYHHEFTRLANGNYMALGGEYIDCQPGANQETSLVTFAPPANQLIPVTHKLPFGTLIMYNPAGEVVWSWKSSNYFRGSDLYYRPQPSMVSEYDVHDNGFSFDEQKQVVYLNFKNINRFLRISYPDGRVTGTYGQHFGGGKATTDYIAFRGQHSVRSSPKGHVYLYDNNAVSLRVAPRLLKFALGAGTSNHKLLPIWEYTCSLAGMEGLNTTENNFASGGNVTELPDESMFACMSGTTTKLIWVSKTKQVLWSAIPKKYNSETNNWEGTFHFHASIIADTTMLYQMLRYAP